MVIDFRTHTGGSIGIGDDAIAALRASLRGSLLLADDPGYDLYRREAGVQQTGKDRSCGCA